MKPNKILIWSLAIALLAVVAAMAYWWNQPKGVIAVEPNQPVVAPVRNEMPPVVDSPARETKAPVQPSPTNVPPAAEPAQVAARSATPPAPVDEPHSDQVARVALSLVGTGDPDAEDYWVGSIFDANLSDQEREDLMEDLNEVGLVNPQKAAPEDLPVILNRLAIIEEIAPYADPFMQEHLGEAYKDLLNLAAGGTAN